MIQLDAAGRSTAIRGAATEASMTASLTELDPASRSITLAINHFACPSPKGAIGYVASATRFLLLAFGSSQPSAGATIFAVSSIERRIMGCGGSTEWT